MPTVSGTRLALPGLAFDGLVSFGRLLYLGRITVSLALRLSLGLGLSLDLSLSWALRGSFARFLHAAATTLPVRTPLRTIRVTQALSLVLSLTLP